MLVRAVLWHRLHLQVGDGGFPRRGSGSRYGDSEHVLRLPDISKQLLQILNHADKGGIQMADLGEAHRSVNSGMSISRTRSAEEPGRRIEAPNLCDGVGNSDGQGRLEGGHRAAVIGI